MKLSFKTILPIILISALLILLAGCFGVPADESPGYTPGTITGIIAAPCCSTSAEPVSETSGSPEYWCYYCQGNWLLQDGIEVVLTYGEDEVATTTTNEDGEFTFTNVDPGKNYVITAYCPDFEDNRPLVKDVALEVIEGGSFDTKITDLVSTSLGLVVDFLVQYTEWGPEDISLDAVLADRPTFPNFPKFKALIYEVRRVVENCELNLLTDDDVLYATCRAAEEISGLDIGCGAGYTPVPPPGPPPTGKYNLYLIADPWDGAKTLTGAGAYDEGTQNVAVDTEANSCYIFQNWTVDVGDSSWVTGDLGTEPLEVDMNGNVTLTAHFACPAVDPDLVIIISESPKARTLDISRLRNGRQAEPEVICYPNCAKIDSVTVTCECTEGSVFPLKLEPPYDPDVLNIIDHDNTGEIDIDYLTGEICFNGDIGVLPKTFTIDVTYTNPCGDPVASGTVTIEFKDCSPCAGNVAPVLTVPDDLTVKAGDTYTGTASATDDGIKAGFGLVFSASVSPDPTNGLTIDPSTGAINWVTDCADIIDDAMTDYVVTVTVDDGCELVSDSFTITLNPEKCDPCYGNIAPNIISTPSTFICPWYIWKSGKWVHNTYYYDVEAEDPDSDILTFELVDYPASMSIASTGNKTARITWNPNCSDVQKCTSCCYWVEIKVTDDCLAEKTQRYQLCTKSD